MAALSTSCGKDICMVDENEVENSTSQKRSSMAQVIVSQKKFKSKLFPKTNRPSFWLGFHTMNWTNTIRKHGLL